MKCLHTSKDQSQCDMAPAYLFDINAISMHVLLSASLVTLVTTEEQPSALPLAYLVGVA